MAEEETAFQSEKNEFDIYVRQRGLADSIRRFQQQLSKTISDIQEDEQNIKEISKELRKLPNKKEVEEKYIEYARLNIMTLDAWDPAYDGAIHLLKPIKAQGTLENKIILAQFVALFPTMKTLDPKKAENKAEKAAVNGSAEDATVSAPSVQIDLSKVKIEPLFADDVDFETFSKSDFRVVKIEACEAVPKSKKLLKFTLNDGTDRKRTILSGIHEYYEPEELVGKTCVAITNLPPRKMMGIDSEGMLISAVYEYDGREGLNLLMLDDSIPAGAKLY